MLTIKTLERAYFYNNLEKVLSLLNDKELYEIRSCFEIDRVIGIDYNILEIINNEINNRDYKINSKKSFK